MTSFDGTDMSKSNNDDETVVDLTRGYHRRLYPSFINGKRICAVSMEAEAFFWRLTAVVDDFGNFHGEAALIRSETQGRREFTLKQIERWLEELASKTVSERPLVEFYDAGSDVYLHIVDFELFQPAGRNGRRIKRFPFAGESGGIRGNPVPPNPNPNPNLNPNPRRGTGAG